MPFLFLYQSARKLKTSWLKNLPAQVTGRSQFKNYYALAVLVLAGLSLIGLNLLEAKNLKPENYGQKSLLYKISLELGGASEDEINSEEDIIEGPISQQNAPTSYLADTAVTEQQTPGEQAPAGINSLLATTQDNSALISPEITDLNLIGEKRDKIIAYVIQPGDTVSTIAFKFGINTQTVLWENNLSAYSLLKLGQTLKILPVNGISYKIKKGDTLKTIAKLYKGNAEEILEFNKLASETDLDIGETLIIPGGVKPSAVAAAPNYSLKNVFTPSAKISGSKLQWPTTSYRLTQYFSWRHTGLDIGNQMGQPTYAAEGGVVIRAGWNSGGYGNLIVIDHGNGMQTWYGHHSKIYVAVGQRVARGQVIGAIGSTGRSTGPHLHFEVRVNGVRVNPLGYVR
ncbi:MAG: M23 family metallopeptidase [Candidatus Komeilibacteria bacterium]|nr:M23 family metallopeptidase [Candidatus Komeilibacteria bacterium]